MAKLASFILEGNAYIKKLPHDGSGLFPISLNSKYAPIPIPTNMEFKIFDKVVG